MTSALDRAASTLARAFVDWAVGRVAPERREWLAALRAELEEVEGGLAQLAWAIGGLRLAWTLKEAEMVSARNLEWLLATSAAGLALPAFVWVFFLGGSAIGAEAIAEGKGALLVLFFLVIALLAGGLVAGAVLHGRGQRAGLTLLWLCPLLLLGWLVVTGTPVVGAGLVPLLLASAAATMAGVRRRPA